MEWRDLEKQLYKALQQNLIDEVVNICEKFPDGGLHMWSIHKGTILHLAIYYKKYQIAHKLLDSLNLLYDENKSLSEKLTSAVDSWGHTLLHCATLSDNKNGVGFAKRLLSLAPDLLEKYNQNGETAIFSACRHGNLCMFKFLAEQVDLYCVQNPSAMPRDDFLRRLNDGVNVLQLSIRMETFDMALKIVERYPNLCKEQCPSGRTALQMLACCPFSFLTGTLQEFFFSPFTNTFYEVISEQVENGSVEVKGLGKLYKLSPGAEIIEDYIKAVKIARVLVKKDNFKQEENSALLLGAENGRIEIVKEILKEHPFAIEQLNGKRQNLLHLVIKNRHWHIFYYIMKCHKACFDRMCGDVDDDGNSILHMLAPQAHKDAAKVAAPFFRLSRDLNMLEKLKKICPPSLSYHQNNMMQTANKMYASNSKTLQEEAKKWLDLTAQQGMVVAGIIITIVFGALFQIPGGPNTKGIPNLLKKHSFRVFMLTDVLSLASALISIITLLLTYTAAVTLDRFRWFFPMMLLFSFFFLAISIVMMMITFASTVILFVHAETHWIRTLFYFILIFPPLTYMSFLSIAPLVLFIVALLFTLWVRGKITGKLWLDNKQANDQDEEQGSSHSLST